MKHEEEDTIKRIAYTIYQCRVRNGIPGDAKSDWFDAVEQYEEKCNEQCTNRYR